MHDRLPNALRLVAPAAGASREPVEPVEPVEPLARELRQLTILGYPYPPAKKAAALLEQQAAEIGRLTVALKKSNDQAEHFERQWYLRGDELEQARAAIAQQPAPDEKCSPDGLRYKLPPLSMTGHQLRQALEFCNDDMDTELHVALRPGGTDTEGEKVEAGLCCWLAEYPEEGSILLDGRSLHDAPQGAAIAQPAEPRKTCWRVGERALTPYGVGTVSRISSGIGFTEYFFADLALPAGRFAVNERDMQDAPAAQADAQPVAPMPDEWVVKVHRLVQGFEHVSGLARLWEPDYSTGSERAQWARATEACADVAKLLAAPTARQPLPMTSWQPMRTAPKDGLAVLVLTDGSDIPKGVRWLAQDDEHAIEGAGWYMTWDGYKLTSADGPRYWMPIPDDPDDEPDGITQEGE